MFFLGRISRWWRDRSRNIFRYFDGTRWKRVDPLTVGDRLEAELPDRQFQELIDLIRKNPAAFPVGGVRDDFVKRQKEARRKLAAAALRVFDLAPLTEDAGVTGAEAIGVLTRYFLFMEDLAAAARPFADSPNAASPSPSASPIPKYAEYGGGDGTSGTPSSPAG